MSVAQDQAESIPQEWISATTASTMTRGDQPSEIVPKLFLSGHPARFTSKGSSFVAHPSLHLSDKHNIGLIVNCCAGKSLSPFVVEDLKSGEKRPLARKGGEAAEVLKEIFSSPEAAANRSVVFHIAADDLDEYDMATHFGEAAELISDVLKGPSGRGVLVHCQMGVSRSASVVAATLMSMFPGVPLDVVLSHMEKRRSCVSPNPGFLEQLKKWEAFINGAKSEASPQDKKPLRAENLSE